MGGGDWLGRWRSRRRVMLLGRSGSSHRGFGSCLDAGVYLGLHRRLARGRGGIQRGRVLVDELVSGCHRDWCMSAIGMRESACGK